eukprot:Phypoly_transcript_07463.p1 GENE.Phypoly_transcript_07463~~Phypoly_transcript_07463.p1  ORF type:complete len:207 (+),score=32.06 Phypoly_transcript_07463:942-1562(+)
MTFLLQATEDTTSVCAAACNTLLKFASSRASCLVLIECQTISYIVPLISSKTVDSILLPALELLAALTAVSDKAILEALEKGAVPALQQVISHQPDLALQCCCNLAKNMKGKEAIVQANMLPTISQLLQHKSSSVQQRALTAVMLLCIVVGAKKQACEIPMLIDYLTKLCGCGNEIDRQYASATLVLIGEYPPGRQEIEKTITKYG